MHSALFCDIIYAIVRLLPKKGVLLVKRILAFLLCCVLFLAVLPARADAAKKLLTKEEALIASAKKSYTDSLEVSEKESFAGFCGLMTSHQLWKMGINSWLLTNDGNKQFDCYSQMEKTSGGYYIQAYSAEQYTLEEALNVITRNGTRDVYNLLVGFEWTETEAGAIYGHACVINGILDGNVYFVESFPTSIGGAEGNVIVCSIREFAEFFADWTVFEGVISFGTGIYEDCCQIYDTDLFVRTRFESTLRSLPCLVGDNGCAQLRSLKAGELLRVNAVCIDPSGVAYYRVGNSGNTAYVAANAVSTVRINAEGMILANVNIPGCAEVGGEICPSGTLMARHGMIFSIETVLEDSEGVGVSQMQIVDGMTANIEDVLDVAELSSLEAGTYKLRIYADASVWDVKNSVPTRESVRVLAWEQTLQIGSASAMSRTAVPGNSRMSDVKNGWVWENDTWYLYAEGQPCSGWVKELGVEYYLQPDGAVSTGWTEADGALRYFSETGALCSGWLSTLEGTCYLEENGVPATGWRVFGEDRYCFGQDGYMLTEGTGTDGDITYRFQPDGKAVAAK